MAGRNCGNRAPIRDHLDVRDATQRSRIDVRALDMRSIEEKESFPCNLLHLPVEIFVQYELPLIDQLQPCTS